MSLSVKSSVSNAYLAAKIPETTLNSGHFEYNVNSEYGMDGARGLASATVMQGLITQARNNDINDMVSPFFTHDHLEPGEFFKDIENNITIHLYVNRLMLLL